MRVSLNVIRLLVLLFVCHAGPAIAAGKPLDVVLLSPAAEGNDFWDLCILFTRQAASNLNIRLEVVHGDGNRFLTTEQAEAILNRDKKPDYLVFNYFFSQGSAILDLAEKQGVKTLIINTDIPERELVLTGKPGEKYPHWIGRIIPDDRKASEQLTALISDEAGKRQLTSPDNKHHMIAINGLRDSTATVARAEGLMAALHRKPTLLFHQQVYANWSADIARSQSAALLERYPATRLIWAASDAMALAALESASARGLRPGQDILAVGVDWTPDGLNAIEQGRLLASAGGQFMDGALALVMIADDADGIRTQAAQRDILRSMAIIRRENLNQYRQFLNPDNWKKLDFQRLRLKAKDTTQGYAFDTDAVVSRLMADH